MAAPKHFTHAGSFHFVLTVSENQSITDTLDPVDRHVGFRTTHRVLDELRMRICNRVKNLVVEKPDESCLFVLLPCGEVIEITGKYLYSHTATIFRSIATLAAIAAIWIR